MGKINNLLENLDKYPIDIRVFKGSPFESELIEIIESEGFGSLLDPLLMSETFESFHFYWRYKEDARFGGEANIQSLMKMFYYGWPNILWFDNLSNSDNKYLKQFDAFSRNLYGFDAMEESMDNTRVAAFYVDKEKLDKTKPLNPDIWLFNADDPKYLLSLNFQQYLEKLTVTKGFFGWQTFFLDWDRMDFNDPMIREVVFPYAPATSEMEEFLEIMPKIFPDQDYTEYHQLYADWKAKAEQYGF